MRDDGVAPVVEPDLVGSVEPGDEHVPGVKIVVIEARGAGLKSALRRKPCRCPSIESHSMRTICFPGSSTQRGRLPAVTVR
jgi:hypothetical protein